MASHFLWLYLRKPQMNQSKSPLFLHFSHVIWAHMGQCSWDEFEVFNAVDVMLT